MRYIHSSAVIYPNVKIEDDVYIGPFCIIGAPAESLKHWNDPHNEYTVIIKSGAKLTGHVTVDAGTVQDTVIGKDTFIMKGCHIGHDATIQNNAILSPHVVIGGHSVVGKYTNMGMASIVHQRVSIPSDCMIGMNSTITKSTQLEPNGVYVGSPAKWIRWNNRRK